MKLREFLLNLIEREEKLARSLAAQNSQSVGYHQGKADAYRFCIELIEIPAVYGIEV